MDKWSEVQAKRMTMGGNEKALQFFKSHPDYRENMPIPEKYQTEFAIFYKEKLTAECEGKEWTMPPIGSKRPVPVSRQEMPKKIESANGPAFALPDKAQNEEYFANKGIENLSKPTDLPPSQGGKYQGFGSSYDPDDEPEKDILEDPLATISKGWSMFSSYAMQGAKLAVSGAEQVGKLASENVIKPTATAIRDPNFQSNMSTYVNTFGKKVTEIGSKGLSIASDVASKGYDVASTTLLQGSNYSPINDSNFSPGNAWGDTHGQPLQYEPQGTEEGAQKDIKDDWDTWGEPASSSLAKTEATAAADLEDKWDEF